MADLLRTGRIAAVVTTNFDENIEQAIEAALGRPARCCVSRSDYEATATDQADVYKLHGTISKPDTISATLSQTATLHERKHRSFSRCSPNTLSCLLVTVVTMMTSGL